MHSMHPRSGSHSSMPQSWMSTKPPIPSHVMCWSFMHTPSPCGHTPPVLPEPASLVPVLAPPVVPSLPLALASALSVADDPPDESMPDVAEAVALLVLPPSDPPLPSALVADVDPPLPPVPDDPSVTDAVPSAEADDAASSPPH